jgi:two-component system NarL family response regulator/two-component system nitrate/nitrite response regulator NarL
VSRIRLFSEAVAKLVEDDPDITIVGEPGPMTTLEDLMALRSQVVLIDHRALYDISTHVMAENGFDAKLILMQSKNGPLLLDGTIAKLISKGTIAGILSADASGESLKKAVKVVASGELWMDHLTIKNILTQAMFTTKSATRRESEIAGLILRGYCNKEIARELRITLSSVKSHCSRLFAKYNVSGRLDLALKLGSA